MLKAYEHPDSFFNAPATGEYQVEKLPNPANAEFATDQRIGSTLGPYKLLEQVGEGGMGVVYVAEQTEPVRRRVALKIIKPGMDTKQVIARFEAERQALAMMDHQHIAKVLDAGTTEVGRPYFVMELVRGMPFTDYCDKVRLSPRQRLELFVDVCHAIQHAHQKGIIHRDLKPSNILITLHDGKPVVKVIDFGVAKAIGQQLTERTVYTALTQLVGTPLYMSPEQAELSGLDIDTRSDVYSLGVLLYELLTGQTPFDKDRLQSVSFDEMRRMIREDEPLRPSRRFSTLGAAAISTASQHRGVDERRLSRILSGELDWIVMKALEKDRSRRYESASALAADIQRYLSDEPVLACPPTTMYRFQKFARKHRAFLTTTAAIVACLLLGTTVSAWQAVRATTAEAQASANATQAQEKTKEATEQRDEAQKQRDEVKTLADELRTTLYASNMNRAKTAWDQNSPDAVVNLLDEHRPKQGETDLRGFEWYYLHRLCNPNPPLVLNLRSYNLLSVTYSPDGKQLVSSTWGNWNSGNVNYPELKMWDTETGKELFKLNGSDFDTVVFSPDGKRLASATATAWDDTRRNFVMSEARVWNAQTGAELLALKGHTGDVVTLAYSPDGKHLASGSKARPDQVGELKMWNAVSGQEVRSLTGNIEWVAFSPDGKRLAYAISAGAVDGQPATQAVKVIDVQTAQELLQLPGVVNKVAFSPNGQLIATTNWTRESASGAYTAGEVRVWNSQTGEEIRGLREKSDGWIEFAFSPDSRRIATAGQRARVPRVKVSDTVSGEELYTFQQHTDRISALAFSPNSKWLASGAADWTLRIWDLTTGYEVRTMKGENVEALAFSPDGKRLASGTKSSARGGINWFATVNIWDLEESTNPKNLHMGGNQGAISADFKQVASATDGFPSTVANKAVTVWSTDTGRSTQVFKGYANMIFCMAFSPDGQRLAVGDGGGPNAEPHFPVLAKIWDVKTGQELFTLKAHTGTNINSLAFSPDGKRLATRGQGGGTRELRMWDTQSGQELFKLDLVPPTRTPSYGTNVVFSPDGRRFATGAVPEVKIYSSEDGKELLSIPRGGSTVAFSSDGKRIATGGSRNSNLTIWDAQTGKELLTFRQQTRANGLAFSPDGKRIASTNNDGTVTLWDTRSGHPTMTFDYAADRGSSSGSLTKQHHSVTFSADGHRLASVLWDGTVRIWDATPLPEKP